MTQSTFEPLEAALRNAELKVKQLTQNDALEDLDLEDLNDA